MKHSYDSERETLNTMLRRYDKLQVRYTLKSTT